MHHTIVRTLQNGKDAEGSGRGLILRHYPSIYVERVRKTTRTSVMTAGLRADI
jgi:hypothetical protein